MSITPNDFLLLAESLVGKDDGTTTEAALRSAASRAYYSAFHAAGSALPADLRPSGEQIRAQSSHQAVIDAFVKWAKAIRPGRMDAIAISRNLPKLKAARKRADYELSDDFTFDFAERTCRLAATTVEGAARAASAHDNQKAG